MTPQQLKFWKQRPDALICANFIADVYGLDSSEINLLTEKLERKSQLGKPKRVLMRTLQLLEYSSLDVAVAFNTSPKYVTLVWVKVRADAELEIVSQRIYQKTVQIVNKSRARARKIL